MTFAGLLVGFSVFAITGLLHPVVIKSEYYWGKGCWPVFAVLGLGCCAASVLLSNLIASILLAVLGFSFFWTILELFEQEKRVEKGWFPHNPNKHQKPVVQKPEDVK